MSSYHGTEMLAAAPPRRLAQSAARASSRSSNALMDGIAKQSQDQAASIERTEEQASELDRIVEVFQLEDTAPVRLVRRRA